MLVRPKKNLNYKKVEHFYLGITCKPKECMYTSFSVIFLIRCLSYSHTYLPFVTHGVSSVVTNDVCDFVYDINDPPPPKQFFFNFNNNSNFGSNHDNIRTHFLPRVVKTGVGCRSLMKLDHSYVRWKKTINYNTHWKMVDQILWLVAW